jgi:hypothetical protein
MDEIQISPPKPAYFLGMQLNDSEIHSKIKPNNEKKEEDAGVNTK